MTLTVVIPAKNAESGKRLAFCDADDVVAPAWIAALRKAFATADLATGPVDSCRLSPHWLAGHRLRRALNPPG